MIGNPAAAFGARRGGRLPPRRGHPGRADHSRPRRGRSRPAHPAGPAARPPAPVDTLTTAEGAMPAGQPRGASDLLTVAERTDYQETSRHADVVAFVRALRRRAPDVVRVGSMGASAEGRDLPVVVLSGRGAFTP